MVQLRRADVVAAALALLDAEGLDGLTMRKLAGTLGVQAGALYWHFANKQALLDAMADELVAGVGDPLPPGTWREQLVMVANRSRRALLAHREGARVVAGTYVPEPNTQQTGRLMSNILAGAGVPLERVGWTVFALTYYVLGHAIEEQAQAELERRGEWEGRLAEATQEEDPVAQQALSATFAADPSERFAYGLQLMLDGIACQLPASG